LVGSVGREHGGTLACGNLDEQVDQCVDRQLKGKLFGSMYLEKLFQSLRVQERCRQRSETEPLSRPD
jgi:hypothetical protein